MQLSTRLLVVCAVLAITAMGASAQNVLTNGDFETGDLTGWQVFGESPSSSVTVQSPDNGPSAPGTHNAFLDNQAEAVGLTLKQTTVPGSITEGEVFYSFDLKLDQADVGGVLFVEIFAEESGVGIVGGTGLMGPFWPWNVWETTSSSFIAPAGADFVSIQFTATTGATTGSNCLAHVDNVVIYQDVSPVESSTWGAVKSLYR